MLRELICMTACTFVVQVLATVGFVGLVVVAALSVPPEEATRWSHADYSLVPVATLLDAPSYLFDTWHCTLA